MSEIKTLYNEVQKFIAEHDMTETGFGRAALNSPNFVPRLKHTSVFGGKGPTADTITRVRRYMKRVNSGVEK